MGQYIKRIFYFIALNILIVAVISMILHVIHVDRYVSGQTPFINLMIFCSVWGFVGAFISLACSRMFARFLMGVKTFSYDVDDPNLRYVYSVIEEIANAKKIRMPHVGIFTSPSVNAFATGPTKNRSLVAVSTGLLQQMTREEIRGVLAHEMSHILNGDMVTMTLLQGMVNTFSLFFSYLLVFALESFMKSSSKDKERFSPTTRYWLSELFRVFFMILGMIVLAYYSRQREFAADRGSAQLVGIRPMIRALEKLQTIYDTSEKEAGAVSMKYLMICRRPSKWWKIFSTHPSLEERIHALQSEMILANSS